MKTNRLDEISTAIACISNVEITKPFEIKDSGVITGKILIKAEKNTKLNFEVEIYHSYPLRTHDAETIKFINKELIPFNHVMEDGSICIHTYHNPSLRKKLLIDFASLNKWIEKYYLANEADSNYEHIVVPNKPFKEIQRVFLFTNVSHKFTKYEFGRLEISNLAVGKFNLDNVQTSVIQNFKSGKDVYSCEWSTSVKDLLKKDIKVGLYLFIENAPVTNKRFAVKNWLELNEYLSQGVLNKLHMIEKEFSDQNGTNMPLFIGYNTKAEEIHWQAIMLEVGKFPIHGFKADKNYYTALNDETIDWALTRNCSPEYFFGRGKLNEKLTSARILIIGIGAIGSIVATTLTRGGCTNINLVDHDVKEAENICRSEYAFSTGVNNKTRDLGEILVGISPFVEVKTYAPEVSEGLSYLLKSFFSDETTKGDSENFLNKYDIIFDCSTDNDLMYALSRLDLKADVLNLSITNHAKELVCGVKPNYYQFVTGQFEIKLDNDLEDLYNPTGCWSPTFKASYNDINTLVQFAIKNINLQYSNNLELRNFVLKTNDRAGFEIKLEQY